MDKTFYREFARSRSREMIEKMLYPSDPAVLDRMCAELVQDFSPSFFAEIDWQEFRPDADDDNLRQILGYIDDYVFLMTIAANIFARSPEGSDEWLSDEEVASFELLLREWHEEWTGAGRSELLGRLDDFIESIRRPYWGMAETKIRATAEKALDDALSKLTDIRRLGNVVEVILYNARYRYLDLPWTRRRAKAEMRLAATELEDSWSLIRAADDKTRNDPVAIGDALLARARIAERARHNEWAALLSTAAAALARIDPAALDKNEGEWSIGWVPCGRCSMWFAVESVTSMDTSCSYINWSDRGFVFIPAGIGTAECVFCGYAAPVEMPTMFYAEHRGQVVYLAPAKGIVDVDVDKATEFWRLAIEGLRARYVAKLDEAARARFETAAELVTHDVKDFLYAIQMGETIPENHVFNLIKLQDGSALIVDGEKRFARVITPGELAWHEASGRVEEFDGTSPSAAFDAISRLLPNRGPLTNAADQVEQLLTGMVDLNDTIDAVIAEARRRRDG
jgi:hypothetical protein